VCAREEPTRFEQEDRVKVLTLEIPPLFHRVGHFLAHDLLPILVLHEQRAWIVIWIVIAGTTTCIFWMAEKRQMVVHMTAFRIDSSLDVWLRRLRAVVLLLWHVFVMGRRPLRLRRRTNRGIGRGDLSRRCPGYGRAMLRSTARCGRCGGRRRRAGSSGRMFRDLDLIVAVAVRGGTGAKLAEGRRCFLVVVRLRAAVAAAAFFAAAAGGCRGTALFAGNFRIVFIVRDHPVLRRRRHHHHE
jgi:hypothetical protein